MHYIITTKVGISYRPLSRYIGLYPTNLNKVHKEHGTLPSPLEVYRFISKTKLFALYIEDLFPSPLEVYRVISLRIRRK